MSQLGDWQTSITHIARAAHAAHTIAVEAAKHIPDEILKIQQKGNIRVHQGGQVTEIGLAAALQELDEIAKMYGRVEHYEITERIRHIAGVANRLRNATQTVTKDRTSNHAVNAVVNALQIATCAVLAINLTAREVRWAGDYLALAVLEAAKVGPETQDAACAATGVSKAAWPVFITLLEDGRTLFQAAEAAEMITHR